MSDQVKPISSPVVDTMMQSTPNIIGVDCGTMNIVMAKKNNNNEISLSSIRNMYLPLDKSQTSMAQMSNIDYVESDEEIYIIGQDAYQFANMFGKEVHRPMTKGLISPKEASGIDVLKLIMQQLVGKGNGGKCVFSVPAPSVDTENNIIYHQGVFTRIFSQLGYRSEAFNEAMAIIYSQCQNNKFTGLAFSFGAGMCIHGDTKIPLLDGTVKTMKELAENYSDKSFWVYSCKEDGTIVPGKAHSPVKTKTVSKRIELTLDNDEKLECTLDHKIMMKNGSYVEAQNLQVGDSLMPFYRRKVFNTTQDYEQVYNVSKWKFTHRLVCKYFNDVPVGNHVHHIDFNRLNNTPENLQSLSVGDHLKIHNIGAQRTIERMFGKTFDEVYGAEESKKIREQMAESMKKRWEENPEIFEKTTLAAQNTGDLRRGKSFDEIFGEEVSSKIRQKMSEKREGKTFEEIYGEEVTKELKLSLSKKCKKQIEDGNFGPPSFTDQWREKVQKSFFPKGNIPWNANLSSEEYKKHMPIERLRQKAIEQHNNPVMKRTLNISKANPILKEFKESGLEINEVNWQTIRTLLKKYKYTPLSYNKFLSYFSNEQEMKEHCDTVMYTNHKVKFIRIIEEECDVYDLTVDEHHNFATECGIFVHNCNAAVSYKSIPIENCVFSVARSGDWIDENAAMSLGTVPNRITSIKEKGTDLMNYEIGGKRERRAREAIVNYYRSAIEYVLEKTQERLAKVSDNVQLPDSIPIILSGGTSMAIGFLDFFKKIVEESNPFPFQISEIRMADDPLGCVAEGLLIRALMS